MGRKVKEAARKRVEDGRLELTHAWWAPRWILKGSIRRAARRGVVRGAVVVEAAAAVQGSPLCVAEIVRAVEALVVLGIGVIRARLHAGRSLVVPRVCFASRYFRSRHHLLPSQRHLQGPPGQGLQP
jgi:hypothetical protein